MSRVLLYPELNPYSKPNQTDEKLLILAVFVITIGSLTAQNNDSDEQIKLGYVASGGGLFLQMPEYFEMIKKVDQLQKERNAQLKEIQKVLSQKMAAFDRDLYKLSNVEIAARQEELQLLGDRMNKFEER